MNSIIFITFILISIQLCFCDQTSYQYYTSGGIKSGLKADSIDFTLNEKKITLFSGSLHYFRLPQQYWKDRLLKFRAAGLNAVQTYLPWNLHEEKEGQFDFDNGYLNLREFLKQAKEEDLFVVIRIGPYICAEWEMGGFPSWLIKDPHMRLRSNYKPYLSAVEKYFKKVMAIINELQFTTGGPIIMLQFENEFGGIWSESDNEYFQFMKNIIDKSGFNQLLINCDGGGNAAHSLTSIHKMPGVLITDNFNSDSLNNLNALRKAQPNKPLFVTEFWPGGYDWYYGNHHRMNVTYFEKEVSDVIFVANSSINFYMFFGGTNFGFTNGGGVITSYDYDAPLSEAGNYTDKYWKTKELIERFTKERGLPQLHVPKPPEAPKAAAYGVINLKDYLSLEDVLTQMTPIIDTKPKQMEYYNQSFGFILYRVPTNKFKHLKLNGGVSDRGIVLIDGKQVAIVGTNKDFELNITDSEFSNKTTEHMLDIMVENTGRPDWGPVMDTARKGLNGSVEIDDKVVSHFSIFNLEFKESFVQKLKAMKGRAVESVKSPALYRTELEIKDNPIDTYLRLDNWVKGVVFINDFNIGRYYNVGPQKTLYIPAPLLKKGMNDIFVFELHSASNDIDFVNKPDLG